MRSMWMGVRLLGAAMLLFLNACGSAPSLVQPGGATAAAGDPARLSLPPGFRTQAQRTDRPAGGSPAQTLALLTQELSRQLAAVEQIPLHAPDQPGARAGVAIYEQRAAAEPYALTGIELAWYETLPGDLDLNGEVNQSDLQPLARWFGMNRDGFNAHGGQDTQQWNRLDNDHNGIIGLGDIKAIAQHFHAHIDGYRVYRRSLPNGQWDWLANELAAGEPMTLTRAQAESAAGYVPVYRLVELPPANIDVEYKVLAYYSAEDQEGISSLPQALHPAPDLSSYPPSPYITVPEVNLTGQVTFELGSYGGTGRSLWVDFDADGNNDVQHNLPPGDLSFTTARAYPAPGSYRVRLRAESVEGLVAFAETEFTVRAGNRAPLVSVAPQPRDNFAPAEVYLPLDYSDPDGDYVTVNSFTLTDPQGSQLAISSGSEVSFFLPGTYHLQASVEDQFGAAATATAQFTLEPGTFSNPGWTFTDLPFAEQGGSPSIACALIAGRPALVREREDLDLDFLRADDAQGSSWSGSPVHVMTDHWSNALSLSLLDVNGRPAVHSMRGSWTNTSNYYLVAQDSAGSFWEPELDLTSGSNVIGGIGGMAVVDGKPVLAYAGNHNCLLFRQALDSFGLSWADPVELTPMYSSVGGSALVLDGALFIYNMTAGSEVQQLWKPDDAGWQSWTGLPATGLPQFGNWPPKPLDDTALPLFALSGPLALLRPLDSSGSNWSTPQTVDIPGGQTQQSGAYMVFTSVKGIPCAAFRDPGGLDVWFSAAMDSAGSAWFPPTRIDNRGDCGAELQLLELAGQPAIVYSTGDSGDSSGADATTLRFARRG